jgi:hypothetical protein
LASSDDSCEKLGLPDDLEEGTKKKKRDKNAPKEVE